MEKHLYIILLFILLGKGVPLYAQAVAVTPEEMESIYREVKTPYKHGLVMVPPSNDKKMDCPTVFRKGDKWYMTYLIFDGRGYETWLASSNDLLKWTTLGKLMSFSDRETWDAHQKAGYNALQDITWGGT